MKKQLLYLSFLFFLAAAAQAQTAKEFIYVGTNTVRGSEGIYVFEFDRKAGALKQVQTIGSVTSPNFLDIHPGKKYLYAAGVMDNLGSAGAFSINAVTGMLTYINQKSSEGAGACHISIDQTGKLAFVSNYNGGSLAVLPIGSDGSLQTATDVIRHEGSSINKERQQKSYVHSAFLSPDNRFIIVSDLGTDKIYSYEINYASGKIKPGVKPNISVTPGAGPRHLVFAPDGKHIYSAEELYSSVGVFSYDKNTGAIQPLKDTVRSLPTSFKEFNKCADIHTDPKGKFLYMSNRGMDAITIFSIKKDGNIQLIGQQEVMGKTPRNFFVDPKGEYVFVANQDSDNIVVFKLDQKTGLMTYTGNQVKVPSPVCIKMLN